jgi:hypothetical protein
MWHLNIPLFRKLDKVAEHEKHAVLGLARTWWGFAERVPAAMKTAKQYGLSPALPAPAADAARDARRDKLAEKASAAALEVPTTRRLQRPPIESVDVGFEVMRASAFGSGKPGLRTGLRAAGVTVNERGFLEPPPRESTSCRVFRVISK